MAENLSDLEKENMVEKPKGRNVFTNKNFVLCFFGALVSELGATLYSFAVGFYILEISGNNAFLQGVYLAVCAAMLLLFTPVGGVFGDRYNKAKIMYICDYMKGALIIIGAVLMIFFKASSAHIAILFFIGIFGNIVSGIFNPASAALIPSIVEADRIQQANSYFSIKNSVNSILGIILAGILYTTVPIITLFLIVGVCYVLSGISEMFIRYTHKPSEERMSIKLALSDMKEGLNYINAQKAIKAMIVVIVFINFFITPIFGNFIPFFIKTDVAAAPSYIFDSFLKPELWTSVFSVLMGISTMIGAIVLSSKKQADKIGHTLSVRLALIAILMLITAVIYWLLVAGGRSLNAFLIYVGVAIFACGLLIVLINIPSNTMFMRVVDKDKLSKVTSIMSVASQGLTPIASVLAGAVLQFMGSTWLLFICAIGFSITAVFGLLNKKIKEI